MKFSVIFDTGSDVSWIQCAPCGSTCYPQQDPLFDPSKSKTYATVSCNSLQCQKLDYPSRNCSSPDSACHYRVKYGDDSETKGSFSTDTLSIGRDRIPGFSFGCGTDNNGLFGQAAGLLGLGRGSASLVSQLSSRYGAVFSYCLPSTTDSTGFLRLGQAPPSWSTIKYTEMVHKPEYPSFYFVNLTGIKIGGQLLSVSQTYFTSPGTLLDSGTVITRLPATVYTAFRDRFRSLMEKYPRAENLSILDTCYDFSGYKSLNVSVPAITLMFGGGASLDVDFAGILYVADFSQACLAFAPNGDDEEVGIIGNVQQRRVRVVYDIANSRIGFAANACR